MANWREILNEIQKEGSNYDIIRRKYLKRLYKLTGRNVITYYSGWLQKNNVSIMGLMGINDDDKNGFMTTINRLDRSKGLDLILHTPGGETAAVESIIDYLLSSFSDIRVIVPQLAMSGGTMIACSANKILMGKHSSLGPIDPQFGGISACGIVDEFDKAYEEIKLDSNKLLIWQIIISKYNPTLVGECKKSIEWSEQIVSRCLKERMFSGKDKDGEIVSKITKELGEHNINLSHSRHFSAEKCKEIGLEIEMLEKDQVLQDAILSIHHIYMHTLMSTPAYKIIENHNGIAYIGIIPPYVKQ